MADQEENEAVAREIKALRVTLDEFLGGTAAPAGHLDIYVQTLANARVAAADVVAGATERATGEIVKAIEDGFERVALVIAKVGNK